MHAPVIYMDWGLVTYSNVTMIFQISLINFIFICLNFKKAGNVRSIILIFRKLQRVWGNNYVIHMLNFKFHWRSQQYFKGWLTSQHRLIFYIFHSLKAWNLSNLYIFCLPSTLPHINYKDVSLCINSFHCFKIFALKASPNFPFPKNN